jgi:hypothetical protein
MSFERPRTVPARKNKIVTPKLENIPGVETVRATGQKGDLNKIHDLTGATGGLGSIPGTKPLGKMDIETKPKRPWDLTGHPGYK